jgi:predicted PurR-regulated permease PerM
VFSVPRVISFIVLLAIILLVGAIFFQVMAQFLVPLFLAAVLLVVFQPLHAATLSYFPRRPRISAFITTILILLVVLLPIAWLGWNAYVELYDLYHPGVRPAVAAATGKPDAIPVGEVAAPPKDTGFIARLNNIAFGVRDYLFRTTTIFITDETVLGRIDALQKFVGDKLIRGVQSAIGILIGFAIMVISLYYFLADGPQMIAAVMHLSPLDPGYEKELLERFGQVSRAVVVATLLSAVVQGALAGLGYSFALPREAPVFLLTALTMVTAMVPFVGAAAIWVCVCGWVYLYGERVVDGQLLALLSILGGVQVLGPVGILVGPMLVSFLQALLNMLRKELDSFSAVDVDTTQQLAGIGLGSEPTAIEKTAPANLGESASADGNTTKNAEPAPSASKRASRRARRKPGR